MLLGTSLIFQGYRNEPDTVISRSEARLSLALREFYIGIGLSISSQTLKRIVLPITHCLRPQVRILYDGLPGPLFPEISPAFIYFWYSGLMLVLIDSNRAVSSFHAVVPTVTALHFESNWNHQPGTRKFPSTISRWRSFDQSCERAHPQLSSSVHLLIID